jgi:hypothetical protein
MLDSIQPIMLTPNYLEEIHLKISRRFGFKLYWLRETGRCVGKDDFQLTVPPMARALIGVSIAARFRRVVSIDERGWLRLKLFGGQQKELRFATQLDVCARVETPRVGEVDALAAVIKNLVNQPAPPADVSNLERHASELACSVHERAAAAIQRKYTAQVAYLYSSAMEADALIDVSFRPDEDGLCYFRQVLAGDYLSVLSTRCPCVEVHRGVFTHTFAEETYLELHLPFLAQREWSERVEALAQMAVEVDGEGRLVAYKVGAEDRIAQKNFYQSVLALAGGVRRGTSSSEPSFTLSFEHTRRFPAKGASGLLMPILAAYGFDRAILNWIEGIESSDAAPLDVTLTLTLPGSSTSAWREAPSEGAPGAFSTYCRMSVAVQQAMRRWLPYVYFEDLDRYGALATALPLVVYLASKPFTGGLRTDFTYDPLAENDMVQFFRSAEKSLRKELSLIHQALMLTGRNKIARFYHPSQAATILQSVRRRPALVRALLFSDGLLVNTLVNMGSANALLKQETAHNPQRAAKELTALVNRSTKALHGKLKRLYGGLNFLSFGSLLLLEATNALWGEAQTESLIQAVLRIRTSSNGPCRVFLNTNFQP